LKTSEVWVIHIMASYQLTPGLGLQIAGYIRAGCYAHVAAEACGVSRSEFDHWLKEGEAKNAPEPLAAFADEIRTANAQARLKAEIRAYNQDPRAWLEHGPGRDRPGDPGWSGPLRAPTGQADQANPFANPELMHLFNLALKALEKYPEARAHVAALFEKHLSANHDPASSQPEGDSHDPQLSPISPI
jgi:hypothetical protein